MATYIVRPYYGYDCDSEMGFNNGQYLDEIQVDADSLEEACSKAMAEYIKGNEPLPPGAEIDGHFGDWTIYWEFDHIWTAPSGEEYQDEADIPNDPDTGDPIECEVRYLYKYIDFHSDVREA